MGKRVEGRRKLKSIKTKLTSNSGGNRILSRFGKKIRHGQVGPANDFLPRAKALKKLKITLRDFRRLSILKGIYPRIPSKYIYGADKTYYHIKDISHLAHDPLLSEMRDYKVCLGKISKSSERDEMTDARRRDINKPIYTLDAIIKERYPRFIDALHDLDDALNLIHLYAFIGPVDGVNSELVNSCQILVTDWTNWVANHYKLKKAFISIKGIYYQVGVPINDEEDDVDVTYLIPHYFTPQVPDEVDFRVMNTFCEVYIALVKSVLTHLKSASKKTKKKKNLLFDGLVFELSSEVPKHALEVIIISGGGSIGSTGVTHFVSDLPAAAVKPRDNCEVIQPQWLFDALNVNKLISCDGYRPGGQLPVHYSPFEVRDEDDDEEEVVGTKHKLNEEDDEEEDIVIPDDDKNGPVSIPYPPASQFEEGDVSSIMTRTKRKLYKAMQLGIERKQKKRNVLLQARKKIRQASHDND